MLGSQEKFLEPKVNVKFFTVDPYTPCNRVSRPFPIWSIWQIWPLLGQKNMFLLSRQRGKSNMDSSWTISGFFGHQNHFWKFQKVLRFLTQNSVKSTGNFGHFSWPTETRKITKMFKNCLSWPQKTAKVEISENNIFDNIR